LPQGEKSAGQATKVCALKLGGDFGVEHVQWLARQVPGLVCITDENVPGVETIKPAMDLPGWWIKMNAFSPDVIRGDVLLIDLDTLVIRMPALPTVTTVLPDFYRPALMGSGFMYLAEADRARCWDEFNKDATGHMRRCRTRTCHGDQGFLQPLIGNAPRWGSNVVSWKVHCRGGIPTSAEVVCFHGKPRPWHVGF
jgi:hypothetical protein